MSSRRDDLSVGEQPGLGTAMDQPVPLTKSEIDRRIGDLASSLAKDTEQTGGRDLNRPLWIRPADLVERLAPYLNQN